MVWWYVSRHVVVHYLVQSLKAILSLLEPLLCLDSLVVLLPPSRSVSTPLLGHLLKEGNVCIRDECLGV